MALTVETFLLTQNTRASKEQQLSHLARQVYPENRKSLYDSYLDATEKAHGYLLLDLAQVNTTDSGIETLIFPDQHPIDFFVPPIGGKSYD
jgi:hypothetical protein